MKNEKNLLIVFACILFVLFFSCNSKKQNEPEDSGTRLISLVEEWNKAHSGRDTKLFEKLYGDSIHFYGILKDRNSCIEIKTSLFKDQPDFFQQIYGNIDIEELNDSLFKCSFVKRVTVNKITSDYPSYLICRKINNDWKIVTESDLVTDKNIADRSIRQDIPENATKGDYNGDGKKEYMWTVPPKITDEQDCIGECTTYIRFSDPNIPAIEIKNCIGGEPINHGDLNKNGTDEIGLLPDWFSSCWRDYYVWTFINGKWVLAVDPFPTHCTQWENDVIPIEIDPKKDGNVLIRYSELTEDDLIVKTKSVKIRR